MQNRLGLETVSDFVDQLTRCATWVVPSEEKDKDYEAPAPETVSRVTPVVTHLANVISSCKGDSSGTASAAEVREAVDEAAERLRDRGVELRHPKVWFLYSIEIVYAQIEEMKRRSLQMQIPIGPKQFCEFLRELSDNEELTPSDIETKAQVMNIYKQEYNVDPEDRTPFADCIMMFAERQLLDFENSELEIIERKRSMSAVYKMLNEKRLSRRANDGGVQYGRGWSRELKEQTREYFDRLGGINGAARSAPIKHSPDLFSIVGSTFGLTDSVPEDQRTGPLEGAPAPIRVYPRVSDNVSINDFDNPFAYMRANLENEKASENPIYFDYYDLDAMIDDGWAVD